MMKALFTSVYRDGTGYAHAAIETAKALEASGVDTVCRPISLSPMKGVESARKIEHLENKDLNGVDAVIQFSLPHTFERIKGVKNIGMFCWETTRLPHIWPRYCNLMDEIWVTCTQMFDAVVNSGVKAPVSIVPIACDLDRYRVKPEPLDIPQCKDRMVFYTIGEFLHRKNFAGLLRAYYHLFNRHSDVALVIKTSVPGQNETQAQATVEKFIRNLRASLRIYPRDDMYPPVVVITKRLSEQQMDRLHATGDVFVSLSRGESWCMPAVDAMGFKNAVLVSQWGSFPDLILKDSTWGVWNRHGQLFTHSESVPCGAMISGSLTPCFAPDGGIPDGYRGNEFWFEPSLANAIHHMKHLYGEFLIGYSRFVGFGQNAAMAATKFSHDRVGKIMRDRLEK